MWSDARCAGGTVGAECLVSTDPELRVSRSAGEVGFTLDLEGQLFC